MTSPNGAGRALGSTQASIALARCCGAARCPCFFTAFSHAFLKFNARSNQSRRAVAAFVGCHHSPSAPDLRIEDHWQCPSQYRFSFQSK